jgi:hypothetical protein
MDLYKEVKSKVELGGVEKPGMDRIEEEKSRINHVKRRRLGWIRLRSWVEEKGGRIV